MHITGDTIAAIATPEGIGAIGVIRVSGNEAINKVAALFPKKDLTRVKTHTLHFGPVLHRDILLDEVLVSVFKAPHSYTGENSIEISCHGSPFVLQKVMEALVETGIRPAAAGEFTLRAFMNGKLDLSQAEAVADLIISESEAGRKAALYQMRGGFSKKIKELRGQLLKFTSLIELELDFAEEDVEFANREQLSSLIEEVEAEVRRLAESFSLGNVIKAGVSVVIAGRPNAGKSTLLNQLLNEERAIVSDIPGTTRDTIEDVITLHGIRFRFIDTAGIRATTDTLESIGIERTMGKMNEAQIIIYLFDIAELSEKELQDDLAALPPDKIVISVANKVDLVENYELRIANYKGMDIIPISGKKGDNIEVLKAQLLTRLHLDEKGAEDSVVTNIRHYSALQRILDSVVHIKEGLATGLTSDFLVIDIRHALHDMGEITGEITNDEILGNIFSKFCIGK